MNWRACSGACVTARLVEAAAFFTRAVMPLDFAPDFLPVERLAAPDFDFVDDERLAADFRPEAFLRPFTIPDFFAAADFFAPADFPREDLPREDEPPLLRLPPDERRAEPLDLAFAMKPPYLFRDVLIAGCITVGGGMGKFPGRSAQADATVRAAAAGELVGRPRVRPCRIGRVPDPEERHR
jgi:hypothetical protein